MGKKYLLGMLAAALLVLAACGGGNGEPAQEEAAPPAQSGQTAQEAIAAALQVAMHDIYYTEDSDNIQNPPVWNVPAGGQVELTLDNQGGLQHDWAIVQPGSEIPVPFDPEANRDLLFWEAGWIDPGQSATLTFTAPDQPGEYTVICTVPGHYPAMQGRLVVQ
jgi:uncharacterized cupredoxin-like copper-binding protein